MYWFRDGSSFALLPWLATLLVVWLSGWLLATHAFKLEKSERLIVGFGLGVVLYAFVVNVIGRWLNPDLSFYIAALVILAAGASFAWRRAKGAWLDREDLRIWPWLLAGLALFWLFAVWGRGLAIFDEQKNLSLISIIGNGDIPPRFSPDGSFLFAYHYGFHLFAGSLMRIGGMLPWSAFDTAKAVAWAAAILMAGLLGKRVTGRGWGAWAAAALLAFASGTRYLLLLLPPGILLQADKVIQLQGTSTAAALPFSQALTAGWVIDGGPPSQYLFGFLNGILQPFVMAHQGPNTFSVLILLVLWLVLPRLATRWSAVVVAAVLGIWALTWETTYALFIVGLAGFATLYYWKERNLELPNFKPVLVAAAISVPIALLQGGTLTEMARDVFFPRAASLLHSMAGMIGMFAPNELAQPATSILGFSLRWPPAIYSSHLGALSIFSPLQLLVGLFEIGPVLLFTPWITRWAWRRARAGEWQHGVLAVAAWVGFLMPLFLQYEADRDISRLSAQALLTWTLMLFFVVADRAFAWKEWMRNAGVAALILVCFGGIMVAGTQFSAATTTRLGDGFNELDSAISAQIWGKIPPNAKLFGTLGNTTIVSGHLAGQLLDDAPEGSAWDRLTQNPNLPEFLLFRYEYVYIDSRWWDDLTPDVQSASGLDDACVTTVAEVWDNSHVNFRRLLDLRGCF